MRYAQSTGLGEYADLLEIAIEFLQEQLDGVEEEIADEEIADEEIADEDPKTPPPRSSPHDPMCDALDIDPAIGRPTKPCNCKAP